MATDSTQCVKKSRGRPKVFDRDAALDKAMKLFWQHGYEATSLADLVEATGAKAPTLYAEFTNKEGVISCRSRPLYRSFLPLSMKHSCFCEEKSVESALADYFAAIANCFTSKDTPGRLLHDQQLHHPLPRFRRYRQYVEITPCDARRTLQQFFMSTTSARGKSRPTVT